MLWKLYGIKGDTQMKKIDNKSNARFKSVLALILVSIVVIGLLSSSAIRLATAAYLMQSSKKVNTGFAPLDNFINEQIDDMNKPTSAPTTTTPTTKAPETTKKPETTKAPETTKKPETTKAPTTKAPEKTEATTTEEMVIKGYQSVLKSYNDVLTSNKIAGQRPGFTKSTSRSLSKGFITSIWFSKIESEEAVADYLAGKTVTVKKGAATDELCLKNLNKASVIDHTDFDTVKAAVESANKQVVLMGYIKNLTDGSVIHAYNKDKATGEIEYIYDYNESDYEVVKEVPAVKLVIDFNDETNPTPIDKNGKTDSFIASVFPVVTGNQILTTIDKTGVTIADVTYTDCYVEMYYNIETAEIYSLTQGINYEITAKDGILKLDGTVSETNVYSGFIY